MKVSTNLQRLPGLSNRDHSFKPERARGIFEDMMRVAARGAADQSEGPESA